MIQRRPLAIALGVGMLFAPVSFADVTGMEMSPGEDVSSLYLEDGTWDMGEDWGYILNPPNAEAWMVEVWIGSDPVDLMSTVFTDGIDPDVSIIKTVNNETDFDWTDFHIELTPNEGEGDLFIYPESVSSDRFSDIEIVNNPDGSAVMWFFTNFDAGDTPVLFGETVTFEYTFNIPGDPEFGYRTVQIPTPEPTSLLMLLAGVALACRRNRRSSM